MTRSAMAVPEQAVRLRVNGLLVATWTCTPDALEALAAGRLVSDGFVRTPDQILALRTLPEEDGFLGVDAEVPPGRMAAATAEADHRAEHGCGPRFLTDCRPELVRRAAAGPPPPDSDAFHGLFRALFAKDGDGRGAGGHHAAALSDGGDLRFVHHEVARHNAVDKVLGAGLLGDANLPSLGLVTTARISGAMAAKAARAGLAWIASRSVPTTLALEIAALAGMPVIARAAGPDARVFAPPPAADG